jgi:hypothetical protein
VVERRESLGDFREKGELLSLWHYATKREAMWGLAVEFKYDIMWGGWWSNAVIGSYGVGPWKNIRRGFLPKGGFLRLDLYNSLISPDGFHFP